MESVKKYKKQYLLPSERCMDWAEKSAVERAPVWCSVDLRDGNQALVEPMDLETKLQFFQLLVEIGFQEIEVGFPAASDTEYEFLRALIERDLIPQNVTIQVLTQAREHIIRKTFEAINGAKNVVVHVYNSTSVAQREQVFRKSKEEIKQIAVEGAKLLARLTEEAGENYRFEYSPESFTGTEPEYALEVCNAVLDVWKPTANRKAIVNLPATVENAMPHVYAQQVEYICKNVVAAGLANEIELQVAYAIGVSRPVSVFVDTFGTGNLSDGEIADIIVKEFDLRPYSIIKCLGLRAPIYSQTAAYGHFGKALPWERVDRANDLKKYL